jgi:hypothetical protein
MTDKSKSRLIKFGTIFENENGGLSFEGFNIDCNDSGEHPHKLLINAIINRLQKTLEEIKTH